MLSFLSSRPNWDHPTPSHAGECVPLPPLVPGGSTFAGGEGFGESQFRRGDRHCGALGIKVFVVSRDYPMVRHASV